MPQQTTFSVIARLECDFPTKFGIPRQSGLVPGLTARIIFEPEFRNADALRGLEDFSHLWLIWGFSEAERPDWSPTVRPPRLGGNKRIGVFATRSPFRPNAIGLSSVKLEKIDFQAPNAPIIHVSGSDLMSGTPIYDIKPYLAFTDAHHDTRDGFTDAVAKPTVEVVFPEHLAALLPATTQQVLIEVLQQDPRPAYHQDPTRIYGFVFGDFEVKFSVHQGVLRVVGVEKIG